MSVPNFHDPTDPYQVPTSYDDMVLYEPTIIRTQPQRQSRWGYGRKKGPDEIVEIYNPQPLDYPPALPPPVPIHHPSAINNPHPNIHHALFGHPSLAPPIPQHRQPDRVPLYHHDSYYGPEKYPYAHADHYQRAQDQAPASPASPYEVTQYNPYHLNGAYQPQTSTVTVQQGTTTTGQMSRSVDAQPPSYSTQQQQTSATMPATTATATTVPTGVSPPGQPQAQPTRL